MKLASILLLLSLTLPQHEVKVPQDDGSGWCCLCPCGSKAQDKCSHLCIRLQHGKEIIEEPQMKVCSRLCTAKFAMHPHL